MGKIAEEIKQNSSNDDPSAIIQSTISDLMRLEDATGDEEDGVIQSDLLEIYEDWRSLKGKLRVCGAASRS